MRKLVFTPGQWEILKHRYESLDAISEVACECAEEEWTFDDMRDHVEAIYARIMKATTHGGMEIIFDPEDGEEVWLVEELVHGSTMEDMASDFLLSEPGSEDYKKGRSLRDAMRRINLKYAAVGLSAQFAL